MTTSSSTIVGLTGLLALALTASPVMAGHKHGGQHPYQGHYGYNAKWHHPHARWGHACCHGNKARHGGAYAKRGHRDHGSPKMHWGHGKPYGSYGYPARPRHKMVPHGAAAFHSGTGSDNDTKTAGRSASSPTDDLIGIAASAGNFSTLIAAVEAAGLTDALIGSDPLTVLAPSDAAFGRLPEGKVEGLLDDPEALKAILTYHVIAGELTAADLLEQGEAKTLNGATVSLAQLDVAKADVKASNGVIHVLDAVLMPPE